MRDRRVFAGAPTSAYFSVLCSEIGADWNYNSRSVRIATLTPEIGADWNYNSRSGSQLSTHREMSAVAFASIEISSNLRRYSQIDSILLTSLTNQSISR